MNWNFQLKFKSDGRIQENRNIIKISESVIIVKIEADSMSGLVGKNIAGPPRILKIQFTF